MSTGEALAQLDELVQACGGAADATALRAVVAETERLRFERDSVMAGLLAALLPNLDLLTADQVRAEIRRLAGEVS